MGLQSPQVVLRLFTTIKNNECNAIKVKLELNFDGSKVQ